MRSTFTGLNTMVRGIFANQLSLDTVGHNITNASTEGYSRQSVNLAATMCQMQGSLYGEVAVGTGVDSTAIVRARNVYADKQYRIEVATQEYNSIMQTNYQKIESTFYDTETTGIQNAMHEFWDSLKALSVSASGTAERDAVVGKGKLLTDLIHMAKDDMVDQIDALYEEMSMRVDKINELTSKIVQYNKQIVAMEANGSSANDLRDQRDLVCDQLAEYIDITVTERSEGYYSVVSNGVTLVNAADKLNLEFARGNKQGSIVNDVNYGVEDYGIVIKETKTVFSPRNGSIKGIFDAIDENKLMINNLAEMSALMLTTFNAQHQAGYDLNGVEGGNFFGTSGTSYSPYDYSEYRYGSPKSEPDYSYIYKDGKVLTGVDIIEELQINPNISAYGGGQYIAAKTDRDLTGLDSSSTALGDNAVLLSNFFDMTRGYTELTSSAIQDLYYYYYNGDNEQIDVYYDRFTTLSDGSTKEVVYRGSDGIVYKVTPAEGEEGEGGEVYYIDAYGTRLTISSEGDDESSGVTFTGYRSSTYTTVSYTTSSNGFLIYSSEDGQIYKSISSDGTVTYTDDKGNTLTRSTPSSDSDEDDDGSSTSTNVVAIYSSDGGVTYTVNSNGKPIRATGDVSIYTYYNYAMSQLGLRSETMNLKVESQDALIVQIQNWRSSEAGVDWNEELTNMIKFQKGYGACARCLTAMDEMLDRLVNSTGVVGR